MPNSPAPSARRAPGIGAEAAEQNPIDLLLQLIFGKSEGLLEHGENAAIGLDFRT